MVLEVPADTFSCWIKTTPLTASKPDSIKGRGETFLSLSLSRGQWPSPQSYHALCSSSGGGINHFVLFHTALGRLPAHVQGGHGGVQHLQVPDSTQRIWQGLSQHPLGAVSNETFSNNEDIWIVLDTLTGSSISWDVSAHPRGMQGCHRDRVPSIRLQLGQNHAVLLSSYLQLSQRQDQESESHHSCSHVYLNEVL